MAVNERAKTTVYLDGKQAEAALDALGNKAKELRKDLVNAQKAGDNIKMKGIERELKRVEAAQRSLKTETFDVERVLKDINKVSWRDLEKAQRAVRSQMKGLERDTEKYTQKSKDLEIITKELNKARGVMRQKQSLWSRLANGANKYYNITLGILATITGIFFSAKEWISGMVGLDDALANVQKTTGLARSIVREMYQDFRTFNTRTPRRELLLLAEEAGRLGKKSRRDVMDFVEVANQIKVALGDDLGGEASVAIREVGKLTEIYKIGNQYGTDFKESMLKMGSAINEVSANSNAQAPYLIDYLKRMGGVAVQSKVSAAEVVGYASALDQLGQSQEMAATAQGKVMVDMFKDSAKYATIARMSAADFALLLNTDANEAFLKVLEGLNGNNEGMSVMALRLDSLGIDGARAVQVLAALASNTDIVRKQQVLANKAMNEGISLTNEYNIKNNNLAGSWEKLGQFIHSKFVNSNLLGWLEKVVGKIGEWTEVKLADTLQKERSEINLLVASITNANNTQDTRNRLIAELQEKYPDFLDNLDTEKVTNEELRDRLKEVNEQYENKILLAIKEDALTDNYKKRLQLKLDELAVIKQIAKYEETANQARAKVANETDPNKIRSLLSDEEITALNAMDLFSRKLEEIREDFSELIDDETELNNAILELQTKIPGATGGENGGSGGNNGGNAPGGSGSTADKAPDDEMPIESWMTNDKLWGGDRDKEFQTEKIKREREFTAFLMRQMDEREQSYIDDIKAKEGAQKAFEQVKDAEIGSYLQIANAMAGAFEESTALGKVAFTAQKAFAIAQIWLNLPKEISGIVTAASFLPPIARDAYVLKSILGAKIRAGANTALVAAAAIQGFDKGGYTDGDRIYRAGEKGKEWIAPNWMLEDPEAKQIIDIMELARQNGSLARLDIRPVVASIAAGTGRDFASGGDSSPSGSGSPNPTPTTPTSISSDSIDRFDKAIERLEKIELVLSVKDVSDKLKKRELRDRQSKLTS